MKFCKTPVLIFLLVIPVIAPGQVQLGGYIGSNNSTFHTNDSIDVSQDFAMTFGIQLELHLDQDKVISLEPGIAIDNSSIKTISSSGNNTSEGRFHFKQFYLPVLFKGISNNGLWTFFGGPSVVVPIEMTLVTDNSTINPALVPIVLDGILGISFRLKINRSSFDLGFRYRQSITRYTEPNEEAEFLSSLKTQGLALILSGKIGIGDK